MTRNGKFEKNEELKQLYQMPDDIISETKKEDFNRQDMHEGKRDI